MTRENIYGIVDLLISDLDRRLKDKQLGIKVTQRAKDFIMDSAYDPTYGARPLKRFIQSHLETLLAREIIGGNIEPDSVLTVDYDGTSLVLNK